MVVWLDLSERRGESDQGREVGEGTGLDEAQAGVKMLEELTAFLRPPKVPRHAGFPRGVEKAREFQKNICFCFIDYCKAFDCVDHNKLWKILHRGFVAL